MAGLTPILPLHRSDEDGFYALHKNHVDVIKQNLKNLLLTIPGERIMDPDFGVGLEQYLFENPESDIQAEIMSSISDQVNIYMPFVEIQDVLFFRDEEIKGVDFEPHKLSLRVTYEILPLGLGDELEII